MQCEYIVERCCTVILYLGKESNIYTRWQLQEKLVRLGTIKG